MKDKNYLITLEDTVKALNKVPKSFNDKNPQQNMYRKKLPQQNKGYIWQIHSLHLLYSMVKCWILI